mgnify:CR=1 FL=1
MKVLFVGDVVGQSGRRVLLQHLPTLRSREALDVVVVNAENAAAGFGITEKIAREFFDAGVDVLSTGNHVWDKKEALEFILREPRLLRPQNYPAETPGSGWYVVRKAGATLGVLNVMGQVFMHPTLACPFACVEHALVARPADVQAILVDFHAEATSEKMAMAWFLDGRASAVVGTHTHVPTADERILPGGTAYISDVGMTGCYDSVIGMDKDKALKRFVDKLPERHEVAEGVGTLCAVILDIDGASGKARDIRRIALREA